VVQTTLLGLAIAFILALIAALVGPSFVDWNAYRGEFEAQASHLVGAPVRVGGALEVSLLPVPSLVLHRIEVGPRGAAKLRAQTLDIKLGLSPLLKGEIRAVELRLIGPEFQVALDRSGQVDAPVLGRIGNPDGFAIERLRVVDGRALLFDAVSGKQMVLDKLAFTGEVRSLAGPFKGEGGFVTHGDRYGYRIATGRLGDDGLRLRFNVDRSDLPLGAEMDGVLSFEGAALRYDGAVTLRRPAGTALVDGKTIVSEPWTVTARVKATPASALLEQVELAYGIDGRGFKLGGSAEMTFGREPKFKGALLARQIDLDRLVELPDEARRLPVAVVKRLWATVGETVRLPLPVQLGLSVDAVTLAGATVHAVSADIASEVDGWSLEDVEFRAPGFTQVLLSGRLKTTPQAAEFSGSTSIDAKEPNALAAWLQGRSDPMPGRAMPLQISGDVMLGKDLFVVERMQGELDRKKVGGRVEYVFAARGQPARLDATLTADEVDVDYAVSLAGSTGAPLERPGEIALALDVGRAGVAGVDVKGVKAKLRSDKDAIAIEQLTIADIGGAKLEASGRIATAAAAGGQLIVKLDAPSLDGIVTVLAKYAPAAADAVRRHAVRYVPANIVASIDAPNAASTALKTAPRSRTSIRFDGTAAGMRINATGTTTGELAALAKGDLSTWAPADLRGEGQIEADDARVLAAVLRIDRLLGVEQRRGRLKFEANGSVANDINLKGHFECDGVDVTAGGKLRWPDSGLVGQVDLSVTTASGGILRRPGGEAVPLKLQTRLVVTSNTLNFEGMTGKLAGADVRGYLNVTLDQPLRIDGRLKADAIDATSVIALITGMPMHGTGRERNVDWTSEPFAGSVFGDLTGQIMFEAARAAFAPSLVARDLQGTARFTGPGVAFEDVKGRLGDGVVSANATLRNGVEGLSAQVGIDLRTANIAAIFPGEGRPPVIGRLSLLLDAQGAGRSPAAFVGSLAGQGTLTLDGGQIVGLDPRAFDAAIGAADRGLPLDTPRIGDIVAAALDNGRLNVPNIGGAITLNGGQMRAATMMAPAQDADTAIAGSLDLSGGFLDLRVNLLGAPKADAPGNRRPEIAVFVRGPLSSPRRTIDVMPLVNWLTMRSVEREARRLEAIETVGRIPSTATTTTPSEGVPPGVPAPQAPRQPTTSLPVSPPDVPVPEKAPDLPSPIEVKPATGNGERRTSRPPPGIAGDPESVKPQQQRPRVQTVPPADVQTLTPRPPIDLLPGAKN